MLSNANVLKTIVQKRHFSSSFGIPKLPKIENEPMRRFENKIISFVCD